MDQIHNKLLEKSQAYADWHNHPHHHKFHWGATIAISVVVLLLILKGITYWKDTLYNTDVIKFSPRTAVLKLEPQTKSARVGETFRVDIILDTRGEPIDGVDIYYLHYDPTIVGVEDSVLNQTGTQISPGSLFGANIVNTVDASTGTIRFSQAATGGTNFTGSGVLASITFKAVKRGSTYINFDFDLADTKDTNAAHAGRDRLLDAVDALFTITD